MWTQLNNLKIRKCKQTKPQFDSAGTLPTKIFEGARKIKRIVKPSGHNYCTLRHRLPTTASEQARAEGKQKKTLKNSTLLPIAYGLGQMFMKFRREVGNKNEHQTMLFWVNSSARMSAMVETFQLILISALRQYVSQFNSRGRSKKVS